MAAAVEGVPLKQSTKDPVWVVTLQVRLSNDPSTIVGLDGRPVRINATYGEPTQITVHAPTAAGATAYVEQQNPGANVVSAELATPP